MVIAEVAPRVIALLEETRRVSISLGPFERGFNLYSALVSTYGYVMACLGDFEEGQALCERGLRLATKINDVGTMAYSEHTYGLLFIVRGEGKNAIEHLQNAVRYGEETQLLAVAGPARMLLGAGYLYLGEKETAREHTEQMIEVLRHLEASDLRDAGLAVMITFLGMVRFELGELDNALSCMEEAVASAQDSRVRFSEGRARTWLGRILGRLDPSRVDEAEDHILQGINILDELGLKPYSCQGDLFLGELYADTGQREKALETLKKAEGAFKEMGMDYWLRQTQEVLKRVEG